MAAHQIVENVVRCAIAPEKEHIVAIGENVGNVCGDAEEEQNAEGDENILFLHAGHAGDQNVQGAEAGNGMGNGGHHIIQTQNRISAVVVTGHIGSQNRAQKAENADKIQRRFLHPALGEGRQRNGDQLNAAQEQRQIVNPIHGCVSPDAEHDDLKQLEAVDEDGGYDHHPVFHGIGAVFVQQAEKHSQAHHHDHHTGYKGQMLPGKIALSLTLIAAKAEEFLQARKKNFHKYLIIYIFRQIAN